MHVSLKDNIKNNEINVINKIYTKNKFITIELLHNTVTLRVDFSVMDYIEVHKINIRIK